MSELTAKERFIKTLNLEEVDRPPVWMMRQAGRYLPQYLAIKEKHPTKEMMQTPEIACEITLQPVNLIGVDAAILYSDILMIPDALGMGLDFIKGAGPHFQFQIDSDDALNKLNPNGVIDRLSYVFEAAALCVKNLPKDFPLLGFAGAPFTVACYMIAGKGSKSFSEVKHLAYNHPKTFHNLMTMLTDITITYLEKQIDAGAICVQLFDTWAGLLSLEDYDTLAKPYSDKIFLALKQKGIKTIHYIKGGAYLLDKMTAMNSSAIGVDWRVDLQSIRQKTKNQFALQGNFDPDYLMTNPKTIEEKLDVMFSKVENKKRGYIVNLGHGIGQYTPVDHAKHFVKMAQQKGLE